LIQSHRRCGGPVRPEARGILLESATMTTALKIDFVSDISCPWCAIGLGALEQALDALKDEVSAELHFQPFELNPQMPPGGQDITEHLTEKYGSTRRTADADSPDHSPARRRGGLHLQPGRAGPHLEHL
jgi:predicted DsbA family dithiol-disulfide isomerase